MATYSRSRHIDPTGYGLELRISMMSNESLRILASKPRGFDAALARQELARRDREVGLAE